MPSESSSMHDLVIRNGCVVDGTGKTSFHGDIAVKDGFIAELGKCEIRADGQIVPTGFVDAQVTWDPELSPPSSWHGVTTVVMGNCGGGFAPVRGAQEAKSRLI